MVRHACCAGHLADNKRDQRFEVCGAGAGCRQRPECRRLLCAVLPLAFQIFDVHTSVIRAAQCSGG